MKKCLMLFLIIVITIITNGCDEILLPDTPKNVTASVYGNTLSLNWTAVSGAEKYHVFRKMEGYFSSSGSFSEMTSNPSTNSYTENIGSATGTTYTYQVCAERNGMFSKKATSNSVTH